MKKTIITDLDGTIALIEKRRLIATKNDGSLNWDVFFDPKNIALDKPNYPVIQTLKLYWEAGFNVFILSARSDRTKEVTKAWLLLHGVSYNEMFMRVDGNSTPDAELKKRWLDLHFCKDDILFVLDDRQKVVDMWRDEGLTCFQVDRGDF